MSPDHSAGDIEIDLLITVDPTSFETDLEPILTAGRIVEGRIWVPAGPWSDEMVPISGGDAKRARDLVRERFARRPPAYLKELEQVITRIEELTK